MPKEAFRLSIYIDELMNDNWRNIYGTTEAVKEIKDLKELLIKLRKLVETFIEKNGGI